MLAFLKSLKDFDATKSAWLNTLFFITSMYLGVQYIQTSVLVPLQATMYDVYTKDSYKETEYDLAVFIYEQTGNTEKAHETSLNKYNYYCNSYFGSTYLDKIDAGERLKMRASCEFIKDMQKSILLKGITE